MVFSQSGRGPPESTSHSYKVFMKTEDTKTKKKSDVWTAPAAESSSKRESGQNVVYVSASLGDVVCC